MTEARKIPSLRWWIGGILFASTVINYVDRQTLSILAPFLKQDFHWTNTDYANIAIAFRLAYSIGQTVCGRQIDRIGTRKGLTISVIWYSLVSLLTSLANGFASFAGFRFLLGLGESANWPGASKAVSEWFPNRERGLAAAFYDSGSSVGGAVAPFIILPIYLHWGWRVAFVIPGLLGFLWLILWRKMYFRPQEHPRITDAEKQMLMTDIEKGAIDAGVAGTRSLPAWGELLKLRQTWGALIAKGFTDPTWFFVTDWFPIYLVAKGIELKNGLIAVWIPFLAADLGNFFGGWISGVLIKRGWSVGAARKSMVVFGGFGMLLLIPTIFTTELWLITMLFAISTFAYAAFSTIANVLPTDLFESRAVATVSGMSGTTAGIGTIIAFKLIGYVSDAHVTAGPHAFDSIVVVAALVPLVGMILVLLLVRNSKQTDQGLVKRI
jgi:MFS transporter, ACS family, hexuronate transporter